jgi:putative spermidine/putrescine transport system permease protein
VSAKDPAPDATAAAVEEAPRRGRSVGGWFKRYWQLAPGTLWMVLFLLVPLGVMVYVSFWTQTSFDVTPDLTLDNWKAFFTQPVYYTALWTTIRVWLIVLAGTFVVGIPVAVFIGLFVRSQTLATVMLVLAIIPFWTSFLIRIVAWKPMLGQQGAVNFILEKIGLINEPLSFLLFTEVGMIIGMIQIYVVFVVGPVTFMLSRIEPSVIEAARDLGAGTARIFKDIVLPLSKPGLVVGAIFVSVLVLGEFATPASLSGRKTNLLGNVIVTQVGSLKWAFASVAGVVLTVVIAAVIVLLLRVVNLRKEV